MENLDQMQYGRMEELMKVPFLCSYCEVMLDNGVYADFMNSILGFEEEDFEVCYEKSHSCLCRRSPGQIYSFK